jgi:predicted SnoaL-like aldol condensation-catalyzing enzyme
MNSNKEKAIAALTSLQSGYSTALENYLSSENYIQHNLDFPSGRDFIMGALPDLKKMGTPCQHNTSDRGWRLCRITC